MVPKLLVLTTLLLMLPAPALSQERPAPSLERSAPAAEAVPPDWSSEVAAGAIWGAVMGGIAGLGYGFAAENFFHEGSLSIGRTTAQHAAMGTVIGALGGAALGAGLAALRRE